MKHSENINKELCQHKRTTEIKQNQHKIQKKKNLREYDNNFTLKL